MLRDYQQEMMYRLREAWTRYRSVMVQMPTGTGKTVLLAEAIRKEKGDVLIVAHRRELIDQIKETLREFAIDERSVRVESIQKLTGRGQEVPVIERGQELPLVEKTFSPVLVIVDEAHHAVARTYRRLWDWWPQARFLGLTATPCRLSGGGFTDLFDTMLQSYTIQEFIDRGWLSDFEYVSVTPESEMLARVSGLCRRGVDGDYQTKEMALVLDEPESIRHLYHCYSSFARGKKGIVYAINREHAQHIAAYYQGQGVRCAVIDSKTPARERQRLVGLYRDNESRELDVLVNVDVFGEGFDVPEVEFIQLARPTLSLSKYLQQVGRGMRVSAGKDAVLILDQVGLYQTFGLPTEAREWNLMFQGRLAGKADKECGHRIVVADDQDDRMLVNAGMVRIKRSGEKGSGVEVFIQNGRYGIMADGKVTCPAEFRKVRMLKEGYFALATYPYPAERNKTTVIDRRGRNLEARLYGDVMQAGDMFMAETQSGKAVVWDGKGRRYYDHLPEFERVGNVDMVKEGDMYTLRRPSPLLPTPVAKQEVFYNDKLMIIRDVVILNNEYSTVLKPVYYFGYKMLVEEIYHSRRRYRWLTLKDGLTNQYTNDVYWDSREDPYWKDAQLTNAATGRLQYLNPNFDKKKVAGQ